MTDDTTTFADLASLGGHYLSRRAVMGGLLATAATVGLAACGSSSKAAGPTASSSSKTVTIGIDVPFHPLWDYLQVNSAKYFAKSGYTVKWKVLDATTQLPAFGSGAIQVATTVPSFMPRIKAQYGIDTVYLFPLARWTIGPQILVPNQSTATTLADLKGKTVVMPPLTERFGAEQAAVRAVTGENIENYFKLVQTDAAAQQLTLGRADAGFLEAPTTYPLLQGGQFKAIYSVHDAFLQAFGDPAVLNGGYLASRQFASENPAFVKALIAATLDAWNLYQQDEAQVNNVASKVSGIPVSQLQVVGQVLDLANIPTAERAVLPKDVQTWSKLFPILADAGFFKTAPADPSSYFRVSA